MMGINQEGKKVRVIDGEFILFEHELSKVFRLEAQLRKVLERINDLKQEGILNCGPELNELLRYRDMLLARYQYYRPNNKPNTFYSLNK